MDDTLHQKGKRLDFLWGFDDTHFELRENDSVYISGDRYPISGCELPHFMDFVRSVLKFDPDIANPRVAKVAPPPKPVVNQQFRKEIEATFPAGKYSFEDNDRLTHSHGQTTADEVFQVLYYTLERVADMVFFAEEESDVEKLIAAALKHKICIVPYGGGTSVSCALKLPKDEKRMIVSLDTRRMNAIEWIDRKNFRACVQSGIVGIDLEAQLNKEGFTTGHEPDSIEFSTLGGWIATNASGMKKNRYGNIEEVVEGLRIITPRGVIEHKSDFSRTSMGIQPKNIIFGSEGNLGVITKAIVKLRPLPVCREYCSYVFSDFETGTRFLYELSQQDLLPASIRLMDNLQFRFGLALRPQATKLQALKSTLQHFFLTRIMRFDFDKIVAATFVCEGSREEIKAQQKVLARLAKRQGGLSAGAENGKRGYLLTYLIAYIRDFVGRYNIFGETYETTVPWSRILQVCRAVKEEADRYHKEYNFPGVAYVSPRITQLYRTGVCIYFTHGFSAQGVEKPEEKFSTIEKRLRKVIMDNGGSVSHHHGVGKIRSKFVDDIIPDTAQGMIRELKSYLDPEDIFGIGNNVFDRNRD